MSQRAFLRNLARGEAYSAEAPTLWDIDFRTAVAQAELEDREMPGAYHTLRFHGDADGDVVIETTRPELLAACVALVAHPDDDRYKARFDTTVRTPLFDAEVPVLAHQLADPEKGSGIAMICTFGDTTDVTWWRELRLPVRSIIDWTGRITEVPPKGLDETDEQLDRWQRIAGKTIKQAQREIVEMLRESGDLVGEPKPITHPVKFYERGDRPLEIVTTRQWYIRNGANDEQLRTALLARAKELVWHPDYMRARFESWVEGLNGDWLISRQRFFGVPFPVWYRLDGDGQPVFDDPLVPSEDRLPVDPSSDVPDGFTEEQRGKPDGFIGRSRRDGHLGDVVAHAADRVRMGGRSRSLRRHVPDGPAPAGPRHHPHLALLHGAARGARVPLAAVGARRALGVGARSRSQEDVEVEGQRRHAHGAAGAVQLRRRALLGRERTTRAPTPRSTRAR